MHEDMEYAFKFCTKRNSVPKWKVETPQPKIDSKENVGCIGQKALACCAHLNQTDIIDLLCVTKGKRLTRNHPFHTCSITGLPLISSKMNYFNSCLLICHGIYYSGGKKSTKLEQYLCIYGCFMSISEVHYNLLQSSPVHLNHTLINSTPIKVERERVPYTFQFG